MEFRQDCLFFRQVYHLITLVLLLSGVLVLRGSPLAQTPVVLILYLPMLLGLAWCGLPGSRIRIDENGIRCASRRKILWAYRWTEIRALRCGRMNRYPVISVIPIDPPVQDLQSPQSPPRLHFQASRKMRQQIKTLCQCPFEE